MVLRRVCRVAAIAAVMLAAASRGVGAGTAPGTTTASLEGCRERFVIVPGDDDEVRARVPARYELSRDAAGHPLLYITAIRCERYVLGPTAAPTTAAAFAALVKSPDGVGCAAGWPVVGGVKGDAASCNQYVLFAAYDDPAVVSWLRDGTPDLPVRHVPGLRFAEVDGGLAAAERRLLFRAGPGTPSPFRLDAVVRERSVETPLTATFWAETSAGTVRIRFHSEAVALGEAQGTVTVAPRTEMARLLGTERAAGTQPFALIAGNRWGRGSLTKAVVGVGS